MSIAKAELKRVKSLASAKGRRANGQFMAEGIRLLEEAVHHRFLPHRLYYSSFLLADRGENLVNALKANGVECIDIPAKDLRSIADATTPQGAVGVFPMPRMQLAELYQPRDRRVLWCENVSDPGNMGSLLRSALAFGFNLVVVTGQSADVYSPKVVRASAGSVFALRIAAAENEEVIDTARQRGGCIVATRPAGKKQDYSLKKILELPKLVLAIGGEAEGLSPEILRSADFSIAIVHSRKVESLNAAVAGSILMEKIYSDRKERL